MPSRRLLQGVALLVPVTVLAVPAGTVAASAVAVAGLSLLTGAFVWGLVRGPALADISVQRALPARLEVGRAAEVELTIANRGRRDVHVRLVDGCPAALGAAPDREEVFVPAGAVGVLRYPVCGVTRGRHRFAPVHVAVRAVGGLSEAMGSTDLAGEARVLPDLRSLARHRLRARRDLMHLGGARRTRILGRDGDFDRLRDFVPGDDLRHVDWKATARARRPITRVWQAEKAQNIAVLFDASRLMASRVGARTKLDHALQAGLTVAWAGLQAGDRVAVGVFDDALRTWVPPDRGAARFGRLLDAVFDVEAAQRFPRYREAARAMLRLLKRRSLVVWMTDLLDADQGEELLAALRVLRTRHLSLVVALDDPEARRRASDAPSDAATLYRRVAAHEVLDERAALLGRLRAAGAHVVDEPAGTLAHELVDRYLDIKLRGLV